MTISFEIFGETPPEVNAMKNIVTVIKRIITIDRCVMTYVFYGYSYNIDLLLPITLFKNTK
jgi:hypothetical protein